MKHFLWVFLLAVSVLGLTSCSDEKNTGAEPAKITSLKDLQGKKAASLAGSTFQETVEQVAPDVKMTHLFFNDNVLCVQALLAGKVDAVFLDEPTVQLWCARYPDRFYLASIYADDSYSFAIKKNSPLTPRINKIISELERAGELEKFKEKWCQSSDANRKIEKWIHRKDYNGSAGVIRYATDPTQEPMVYMNGSEYVGLEIEVLNRVAYELNMKLEICSMSFGALLEALQANKADLVGGSMSITPARLEKVDFVTTYYKGGQSIMACMPEKAKPAAIEKITDLASKKVGVLAAGTLPLLAEKFVSGVDYVYFSTYTDAVQALLIGKIDAILIDEPIAANFVGKHSGKLKIASVFVDDEYGFALAKTSPLLARASAVVTEMEKAGDLTALKAKWCGADESRKVLTDWKKSIPFTGKNGILRFSAPPLDEPLCYVGGNGEVIGYEMDVVSRIAAELDMELQFISVDPGARVEAIVSGKADISGGAISITPERKGMVAFLPAHYKGGVAILVPDHKNARAVNVSFTAALKNFADELKASFERTFIRESRWKMVLDGLKVTVIISLLSALLGTALAFPVWRMRVSRSKFWLMIGKSFIAVFQGTPILVVLMVLYYLIFARVNIDAVLVAVIGFALNFAAYVGEMLRTGVDSVPKGQREAALALGFTPAQSFFKVVLPQALRQILPHYQGEFINMLKSTSIVGYIAIQDLTKISDIIRSRTYEAFFPLIATAVIYFLTAWLLSCFLTSLEKRLDPLHRRKKVMRGAK